MIALAVIVGGVLLIGFAVLAVGFATAPAGYEDGEGFHREKG